MDKKEIELKKEDFKTTVDEPNKENENKKEKVVNKKTKKSGNAKRRLVVSIFTIICVVIALIMYRGSYLEVLEIGDKYVGAFKANVRYKVLTCLVSFIWIYTLMYTTNRRIKNGLKVFFQEEKREMPKFPNKSISFITAVIGSTITTKIFLSKVILFFNSTFFGKTDQIYGHDIGYYLFTQPFLKAIIIYMIVTFAIVTLYAAVYYIFLINTQFTSGVESETLKNSIIKKQLLNNARIIVILIAAFTFINAENLSAQTFLTVGESGNTYSLVGAGTTDITIKVWGYRILAILMVLAIFIAIPAYYKEKHKRLFVWIMSVPVYLVALILVMIGYDKIFVSSNEYEKEKQYISYNIEYTRDAYGINTEDITIGDNGTITSDEMAQYSTVTQNMNPTNREQVLNQLNNTQTVKGLYKYTSTNVGVYAINGKGELVYISPREITATDNSYTNSTYENTHGYGVVVTSASKTDANGDLVNIQKDFSNDDTQAIKVKYPRIYFGLETNKTIVTSSKNKNEFDYPIEGGKSATNSYDGEAGLKLNAADKLILALSKGDFNLAFSSNLNGNSKILTNRNVIERAKKVMPYLTYDKNPYLVVTDDGKLVWVIDAYTTSKYYPYSQKTHVDGQEINYIKNSVKVLVDAYNGDTRFYITDRSDLIVMAYQKAFPDVFMGIDEEIPQEVSRHFVYSEFLYNVQADILKMYHNTEPDVIYRANDIWDIAKYGSGLNASSTSEATQINPYYTVIKGKDRQYEELALVLPYTMYGKQSLISYVTGVYENGEMKLRIYKYDADNSMIGPMQLDTQVNQNETIYKEIENLDVSGTKITKSIILVPINEKIVYVEAIYQEYLNESNSLPKLKKVIVASGNKIAIGDNIEQALSNLISQGYDIDIENYENKEDIIRSIIKANKNLKESTSSNDYERIGKDINKLQNLIDKLEKLEKEEEEEKAKQKDKIKEQKDEMQKRNLQVNEATFSNTII